MIGIEAVRVFLRVVLLEELLSLPLSGEVGQSLSTNAVADEAVSAAVQSAMARTSRVSRALTVPSILVMNLLPGSCSGHQGPSTGCGPVRLAPAGPLPIWWTRSCPPAPPRCQPDPRRRAPRFVNCGGASSRAPTARPGRRVAPRRWRSWWTRPTCCTAWPRLARAQDRTHARRRTERSARPRPPCSARARTTSMAAEETRISSGLTARGTRSRAPWLAASRRWEPIRMPPHSSRRRSNHSGCARSLLWRGRSR